MKKKVIIFSITLIAVLSMLILSSVLTMSAEEVTEYSITVENDTSVEILVYTYSDDWGTEEITTAAAGTEVYVGYDCWNEEYVANGVYVNEEYYEFDEYFETHFTMPAENVTIVPDIVDAYTITVTDSETGNSLEDLEISKLLDEDQDIWSVYSIVCAEAGAVIQIHSNWNEEIGISGAYINGEFVDTDEFGIIYFTMPAQDVEVKLVTVPKYSITCENNDIMFSCNGYVNTAFEAGAEIYVHLHNDCILTGIRINGDDLVEADEYGQVSFTMPAENVVIEPVLETAYSITFDGEFSDYLVAFRNDATSCSCAAEGDKIEVIYIDYDSDTIDYIVTAIQINGGEVIDADEYGSVCFTMPAEDVVISATVEEYREYSIADSDGEAMYAEYEAPDGEWYLTQSAPEGITLRISAEDNVIGAYINDEKVDADENGYIYFTMPAEDVVVTPIYAEQYDFYINLEKSGSFITDNASVINIYVDASYRYPDGIIEGTAFVGNTVRIYAGTLVGAYINGEKIDVDEYGSVCFTMPEEDVEIILISGIYSISASDNEEDVEFFVVEGEDEDGIYGDTGNYAEEGQSVIIWYSGNDVLAGAYINGEKIDIDENGNIEFTMPAEDVEVELILASFYEIIVDEEFDNNCDVWIDFYTDNGYNCFVPGQEIEMEYYKEAGWIDFTVNGEEIAYTVIEERGNYITVSFIMPEGDALIEGIYDNTQYTITVDSDYGVYAPSSALANEYIFILAEHVPGYTLSMTINGVDYDEFNGGDPDGFCMPAENLSVVITYTANGTSSEEITFEADIDTLPSAGFDYDYTPDIELSESILAAIPEEMRDYIEIIWFASNEAFPEFTFDNYEEFFRLYQMGYNQDLSTFVDGYNYAGAFAVITDKNYVFASDVAIINGVEVPITTLYVDIGSEDTFGTLVFFEFELTELVEKDVSLDISVENLPSEGDPVYDSEIDFELPIDADYVVEDFLWLYSENGEFPEINSFEDFNSLEDFMVEYDAVFVSEGKYAILLLVSVDYGTNITDGTIIFNGKIVTAKVITQEELEASMMANENYVYVLIEFEVSDEGTITPAEILGDAPSNEADNNNQENSGNNPETGDRHYTSLWISLVIAVIVLGTIASIATILTRKSKREQV